VTGKCHAPPSHARCLARLGDWSTALDKTNHNHDHRNDEKDMDEAPSVEVTSPNSHSTSRITPSTASSLAAVSGGLWSGQRPAVTPPAPAFPDSALADATGWVFTKIVAETCKNYNPFRATVDVRT
jgi:hypothetical protein